MKRTLLTLLAALALLPALADEGMWLPSLISERIDDMRAKGFRLTAEDIYSINKASMKDAVVLFNGGRCRAVRANSFRPKACCSPTTTAATTPSRNIRPSSTTT